MIETSQNKLFANRYLLRQHLGTGGFAEVWKAEDQSANNATVVVKIYSPGQRMDPRGIDQFRQEYAIVQNLFHPNLLKPQHFDTFEGHPYLVLPFCDGGNLFDKLKSQMSGLKEQQIATIMYQIGGAMAHLHENNIVHQDIKPDNVLIREGNRYMLSDFGVSTHIRRTIQHTRRRTLALSEIDIESPRFTYITPEYASPEAFNGQSNAPSSDVFSLALMLYELAAGELPFKYPSFTGEALKQGAELRNLPGNYSREINEVLMACLNVEPEMRLSAADMSSLGGDYLKDGVWYVEIDSAGSVTGRIPNMAENYEEPAYRQPPPVQQPPTVGGPETISAPRQQRQQRSSPPKAPKTPKTPERKSTPTPAARKEQPARRPVNQSGPATVSRPKKGGTTSNFGNYRDDNQILKLAGMITGGIVLLALIGFGLYKLFGDSAPPTIQLEYSYEGETDEFGRPNGKGRATYEDGTIYEGDWVNGIREGEGTIEFDNGDVYEGQMKNNEMNGTGTYTWDDETTYEGEFRKGNIDGVGTYTDQDTTIEKAEWEKGEYIDN